MHSSYAYFVGNAYSLVLNFNLLRFLPYELESFYSFNSYTIRWGKSLKCTNSFLLGARIIHSNGLFHLRLTLSNKLLRMSKSFICALAFHKRTFPNLSRWSMSRMNMIGLMALLPEDAFLFNSISTVWHFFNAWSTNWMKRMAAPFISEYLLIRVLFTSADHEICLISPSGIINSEQLLHFYPRWCSANFSFTRPLWLEFLGARC